MGPTSAALLPRQGPRTTRARLQTARQRAESRRQWWEPRKTRTSRTRSRWGEARAPAGQTRSPGGQGSLGEGRPALRQGQGAWPHTGVGAGGAVTPRGRYREGSPGTELCLMDCTRPRGGEPAPATEVCVWGCLGPPSGSVHGRVSAVCLPGWAAPLPAVSLGRTGSPASSHNIGSS